MNKVEMLEKIHVQLDPSTYPLNNIEFKFILLTLQQSKDTLKNNELIGNL